jgi:hypothetical protein
MGSVAKQIGVPMTTVREWRRRHEFRASALAAALVALAVYLDSAAERGQLVRELAYESKRRLDALACSKSRHGPGRAMWRDATAGGARWRVVEDACRVLVRHQVERDLLAGRHPNDNGPEEVHTTFEQPHDEARGGVSLAVVHD